MYRETIICIAIVVLIIVLDIFTQNYTKKSISEMTDLLSELKEIIEQNDMEEIENKIEEVEKEWEDKHNKLAYYIEHDELEKVDTAIVQLKSYVKNNDIPSTMAQLETGKFVLEHIEEKYKFSLQNIF